MKKILLLLVIISIIMPTGCSKNSNIKDKPRSKLETQLHNHIKKNKPDLDIKDFRIVSSHIVKHGMIFMALFTSKKDKYEAFFNTQQKAANELDSVENWGCNKIDLSAAFTHNEMSGDLAQKGENKASYAYVCGHLNDRSIKSINIDFNDGRLVNVIIGTENIYSYVRTDKFVSLKNINALDKDGNTAYVFPPYPPEKK